MYVYKVSRTKYAEDLTGEGARLNGGRWNHKLIPCIYTSESRALAILEYTVNINIDDIPRALSLITIEIPSNLIQIIPEENLPGNWMQIPAPSSTKEFGTKILRSSSKSIIRVPSTVIHKEFNYILNPLNANKNIKIVDITDWAYDLRIKMK